MPQETFTVMLTNERQGEGEVAVADASKYLAYADQTDTFGYHGRILSVEEQLAWVAITFEAPIVNDDELKRFMDEMTTLSRVRSVERHIGASA